MHYTLLLHQLKKMDHSMFNGKEDMGNSITETVFRFAEEKIKYTNRKKKERKKRTKVRVDSRCDNDLIQFLILSPQARRYCHYNAKCTSLCYVSSCYRRFWLSTTQHLFILCGSYHFFPFTTPDPAYRSVRGSLSSCYNACIRS